MSQDLIRYPDLIDTAMRGVVKNVLRKVESSGLPGQHHFYITFSTVFPGVVMSDSLREKYPTEMTVVLQHQFWEFKVEDQYFTATLSFGGLPERLVIPFASIIAFADPSIKFGLQFQNNRAANEAGEKLASSPAPVVAAPMQEIVAPAVQEQVSTAEIISLDAFRQQKK